MAKDSLLAAAFGAGKQKGPKKGEGSGDTQHGELANTETPKKVARTKGASGAQKQAKNTPEGDFDMSRNGGEDKLSMKAPKHLKHETGKVIPKENFSLSRNGAKEQMVAPAAKVMESAHRSKIRATERWVEGDIDSKRHDEIHRRANSVLRAAKRGR